MSPLDACTLFFCYTPTYAFSALQNIPPHYSHCPSFKTLNCRTSRVTALLVLFWREIGY